MKIVTKTIPEAYDYLAPDGSEIRLLLNVNGAGLCHCTLEAGVSRAVTHRTVDEIWYFLEGGGEVWTRPDDGGDGVLTVARSGVAIRIPRGTTFQFRNTGKDALKFLIVTSPPWPGEGEAMAAMALWSRTM